MTGELVEPLPKQARIIFDLILFLLEQLVRGHLEVYVQIAICCEVKRLHPPYSSPHLFIV